MLLSYPHDAYLGSMYIILILNIPLLPTWSFKIISHLSCTHTVGSGGGLNVLLFSHHSKQTNNYSTLPQPSLLWSSWQQSMPGIVPFLAQFFLDPQSNAPHSLMTWSPSSLSVSPTLFLLQFSVISHPHTLCFQYSLRHNGFWRILRWPFRPIRLVF